MVALLHLRASTSAQHIHDMGRNELVGEKKKKSMNNNNKLLICISVYKFPCMVTLGNYPKILYCIVLFDGLTL